MRRLAGERGGLEELLPLLDEQPSNAWLAFQLLELVEPHSEIRDRCLAIVREIASADDGSGQDAEIWLNERGIPLEEPATSAEVDLQVRPLSHHQLTRLRARFQTTVVVVVLSGLVVIFVGILAIVSQLLAWVVLT
jgi:hypothetical protein